MNYQFSILINTTDSFEDLLANKAPSFNPTFTGTVSGITKDMVGLDQVDNTSDADKPISSTTQTALDLKAPKASPTFTGTVNGISKSMVGLGNVDNTSDVVKPLSNAVKQIIEKVGPITRLYVNSTEGVSIQDS